VHRASANAVELLKLRSHKEEYRDRIHYENPREFVAPLLVSMVLSGEDRSNCCRINSKVPIELKHRNDPMSRSLIEIERKWLVGKSPDLSKRKGVRILQGYLASTPEGTEVRLRRQGKKYFETVKTGKGLRRGENEIELSKKQFRRLWPATKGRRLEKVRYTLKWRGRNLALDVYRRRLAGLKVVEANLKAANKRKPFRRQSGLERMSLKMTVIRMSRWPQRNVSIKWLFH
jgi:CYTH domain-containing protein